MNFSNFSSNLSETSGILQYFFPGLDEDWPHKHLCIRVSYAGSKAIVEQGINIIAEQVRKAYYSSSFLVLCPGYVSD